MTSIMASPFFDTQPSALSSGETIAPYRASAATQPKKFLQLKLAP
jgi:hypothetical protein